MDQEAKGSNPITGLTLLWACNPFRGNFNYWQVSQEEAGRIIITRQLENKKVPLIRRPIIRKPL